MAKHSKASRIQGSLSSYVFISIALVFIVVGSVYMVQKRRTESVQSTPTATKETSESEKKSPVASNNGDKLSKPSQSSQNDNQPSSTSGVPKSGTTMPQTGKTDDMLSITMLAVLIGSATAYYRSRNFATAQP